MFIDFLSTINIQYESKLTSLKLKRDKCASSIKVKIQLLSHLEYSKNIEFLQKLKETFQMADEMRQDLESMIPRLKDKRKHCENVIKALSSERSLVEKMKQSVQADETSLKVPGIYDIFTILIQQLLQRTGQI
jgi:hypothetical protein